MANKTQFANRNRAAFAVLYTAIVVAAFAYPIFALVGA